MIMGCGRVGGMLAQMLAGLGDQVTIIDTNPEHFRRLRPDPNVHPIVADGTSVEEMRRAGIEQTDVFVAVAARRLRVPEILRMGE